VRQLNEAPVPKLGDVSPIEINTFLDDYKIRDSQIAHSITPVRAPTLLQRRQNENNYKIATNVLQLDDLVYLDLKETVFTKQYTTKVSRSCFQLHSQKCEAKELWSISQLQNVRQK
jgi:hypothetical protein